MVHEWKPTEREKKSWVAYRPPRRRDGSERLTWHQWVGGTLMFTGAVVLAYV
jgi:hypothetical protein